MIVKHGEQKEAFLKACTLARRTAETFLKYAARSAQVHGQTAAASKAHHEQTRAILDTLLAQENKVRHLHLYIITFPLAVKKRSNLLNCPVKDTFAQINVLSVPLSISILFECDVTLPRPSNIRSLKSLKTKYNNVISHFHETCPRSCTLWLD